MIAAATGSVTALAAQAATSTVPIVFGLDDDPVKVGLVTSFNRPSGNATGVYYVTSTLGGKRLGLIRDLLPRADLVGVLVNPKNPRAEETITDIRAAASAVGQQIDLVEASNGHEMESGLATLVQKRASALVLIPDILFFSRRVQLVTLATRHGIPAIYTSREYVQAGGLMSYGTDLADVWPQVGEYSGRILKGAKPADLPVAQSTKFELAINLQTARAFGLEIPPMLIAAADEVIE